MAAGRNRLRPPCGKGEWQVLCYPGGESTLRATAESTADELIPVLLRGVLKEWWWRELAFNRMMGMFCYTGCRERRRRPTGKGPEAHQGIRGSRATGYCYEF